MVEFGIGDSYYSVLGVSEDATQSEIKQAWVEQTKATHADKTGESKKYEYLLDAGEVLKDDEKRQAYDVLGHELFVERYGRRGNKRDIDPVDLDETTADTTTTTNSTTTEASTDRSSRSEGNSTADNGEGEVSETGSREREGKSRNKTDAKSTSESSHDTETQDSGKSSTGERHDPYEHRSDEDVNNTSRSNNEGSSIFGNVKGVVERGFSTAFILPMVQVPVTTRVIGLVASMFFLNYIATGTQYEGSTILMCGMVVTAALVFLAIRWVPDLAGAKYPRESELLNEIPVFAPLACLTVTTGIAVSADRSVVQAVIDSVAIVTVFIGVIVGMVIAFLLMGIVFAIVALIGGATREGAWATVFWSCVLGGVFGVGMLTTTAGDPREEVFTEILDIGGYPWVFVESLPVYFVHLPMLATYLLATLVTIGLLGGIGLSVLVLFHHPQRYAYRDWYVRPTIWETAVAIPIILLVWVWMYGPITDVDLVEMYISGYVTTETGLVEFIWVPLCVVILIFNLRRIIEPNYSEWRSKK